MRNTPIHSTQRGLSIIELMVGIAVGLFIVGGATKMFVEYLNSSRNSMLGVRLNQDLRVAADLVARDLRRAGFWRSSASGVWSSTTTSVLPNPYNTVATPSNGITYSYDKGGNTTVTTVAALENFGFMLNTSTGTLQARLGDNVYQDITDPNTVRITAFTVTSGSTVTGAVLNPVELYQNCPCLVKASCTLADFQVGGSRYATRPLLTIQMYNVTIAGESRNDTTAKRQITETVRVRNDKFSGGACTS